MRGTSADAPRRELGLPWNRGDALDDANIGETGGEVFVRGASDEPTQAGRSVNQRERILRAPTEHQRFVAIGSRRVTPWSRLLHRQKGHTPSDFSRGARGYDSTCDSR